MSSDQFLNVKTPDGFKFVDFDLKPIKKNLRVVGRKVAAASRKAVSREAVSRPGEFPGKRSGELQSGIKHVVVRSGRSVKVIPTKTEKMKVFYPAFVVYGHRAPRTDSLDQQGKKRKGRKIAAPRKNFITEIAQNYGDFFEKQMEVAFNEAIKT